MRIALSRENASVPLNKHQATCCRCQRILRWIAVDMQDVSCIPGAAGVHHIKRLIADAACYNRGHRDAGLDNRV
jgi:hypothetical protein